jgi:hypothetical protein
VARHSQLGRLERLLAEHGRLAGGSATAGGEALAPEVEREIWDSLRFVFLRGGAEALGDLAGEDLRERLEAVVVAAPDGDPDHHALARAAGDFLRLESDYPGRFGTVSLGQTSFHRHGDATWIPFDVRGFAHAVPVRVGVGKPATFVLDGDSCTVRLDEGGMDLEIARANRAPLQLPLAELLAQLHAHGERAEGGETPDSLLVVTGGTAADPVRLRLDVVRWTGDGAGSIRHARLEGLLLLGP